MKFRRFLCLLLILSVLLSGCVDYDRLRDAFYGRYDTTPFAQMEYTRPDLTELQTTLDTILDRCQNAATLEDVLSAINDFYSYYDRFFTNCALANIHYCANMNDIYWRKQNDFCAEAEPAMHAALEDLYQELAKSPFRQKLEQDDYFGADFFVPYESEDIYDSVYLSLLEEEAELVNQYYALTSEGSDLETYSEEYFSKYTVPVTELLVKLVTVRQKIAAHTGYADYVEYAYACNYARDYSPAQAEDYVLRISDTFSDLYARVNNSGIWQEALSQCAGDETFQYVSQVANAMGGDIQKAFQALSDSKLYDIGHSDNKYPASFELYLWSYASPYVFIYPYGDQGDKLTFAHEFGHFVSDYLCYGTYAGTDIAEIHSQGFEYLSLCYGEDVQTLTKLKMADSLYTYVECSAYTLFEHQLYRLTGSDLTAENILRIYEQIGKQFGFDCRQWDPRELIAFTHIFTDPLYNISYVVSNDLALQLYQLEQGEQGAGLQLYLQCLTDESSYLLDFAERYDMESPFAAGRLENVAQLFQKKLFAE